jgi:hypothetical protein
MTRTLGNFMIVRPATVVDVPPSVSKNFTSAGMLVTFRW